MIPSPESFTELAKISRPFVQFIGQLAVANTLQPHIQASVLPEIVTNLGEGLGGFISKYGLLVLGAAATLATVGRYVSPFAIISEGNAGVYLKRGVAFRRGGKDGDLVNTEFYGILPPGFYFKAPAMHKILQVATNQSANQIPPSNMQLLVDRERASSGKTEQYQIGALATWQLKYGENGHSGPRPGKLTKGQDAWNVYHGALKARDNDVLTQAVIYGACQAAFLAVMKGIEEENFNNNTVINERVKALIDEPLEKTYGVEASLEVNLRNRSAVQVLADGMAQREEQQAAPGYNGLVDMYGRPIDMLLAATQVATNGGYHGSTEGLYILQPR